MTSWAHSNKSQATINKLFSWVYLFQGTVVFSGHLFFTLSFGGAKERDQKTLNSKTANHLFLTF
jgi:hypothetical protein